jgi:NADPH:quinone reductase-like Zn-dependent oxidoreductase
MATLRRVFVGSRASFEAMNRVITQARIKPIIDRVFAFSDVHDAYRYLARATAFGKVVITGA